MDIEYIFFDCFNRIKLEISKAEQSILVLGPWYTDKGIFDELVNKARNGCNVTFFISRDSVPPISHIDFELLNTVNSKIYIIPSFWNREIQHLNFCNIDDKVVIGSSSNWSYNSELGYEYLIVSKKNLPPLERFSSEVYQRPEEYFPYTINEELVFPLIRIINQLHILDKELIHIDSSNTLESYLETLELDEYNYNAYFYDIVIDIAEGEFASAIIRIQNYLSQVWVCPKWKDLESIKLKLETRNLNYQLIRCQSEKRQLEQFLSYFEYLNTKELGEILLNILILRKEKFKMDQIKYDEAQTDESQYRKQLEATKEKEPELASKLADVLKMCFRKELVLSQPDLVTDEYKFASDQVFFEVSQLLNDLILDVELIDLDEIDSSLEEGSERERNVFRTRNNTINRQIKFIESEIVQIKMSEAFRAIVEIKDWDDYFERTREKLQKELEELRFDLETSDNA